MRLGYRTCFHTLYDEKKKKKKKNIAKIFFISGNELKMFSNKSSSDSRGKILKKKKMNSQKVLIDYIYCEFLILALSDGFSLEPE